MITSKDMYLHFMNKAVSQLVMLLESPTTLENRDSKIELIEQLKNDLFKLGYITITDERFEKGWPRYDSDC